MPDFNANQAQSGESNMGSHPPNLPIFALYEGYFQPRSGNMGAVADGRHPIGDGYIF